MALMSGLTYVSILFQSDLTLVRLLNVFLWLCFSLMEEAVDRSLARKSVDTLALSSDLLLSVDIRTQGRTGSVYALHINEKAVVG